MMIFFCLGLFLTMAVLSIAVQRWLFKRSHEKEYPEWELYQQRYD
jgi:hypothetical protein